MRIIDDKENKRQSYCQHNINGIVYGKVYVITDSYEVAYEN